MTEFLPGRRDFAALSGTWKPDVIAGLTVAIVALPLALGFGVTTGLGAQAGLVTAIVAGFVAAALGGSHVQVSGPTGAMTVVLVPVVAHYGAGAVLTVGLIAGVLVAAAGLFRLGRFVALIPWPVVEGFTVGIAVIIFLQQVPAALGVAKPKGDNTAVVAARALGRVTDATSLKAAALVGLVAFVMVVGPRLRRSLPVSLIAIVAATVAVGAAGWHVARIGALPSSLPAPRLPDLAPARVSELFSAALAVAALAALESLLSAKVADGMADGPRHDPNRELFGQGLANIASSLFGGMPATGAIARTAVNVRAGARSRLAAMVHAALLVLVVFFGGALVARIPLAALAGVLMVTAVRMVDTHNVRAIVRSTRGDAAVMAVTAIATVAFDLIVAVEIGLAVAIVLALRDVAQSTAVIAEPVAMEVAIDDEQRWLHEHIVTYRLDGALFFGAAQAFLRELVAVGDVRVVILRLPNLQVLDATGAQAIGDIIDELERRHITVLIKGARADHHRLLTAVGALDRLADERHVFDDLDEAIAHARSHAARAA
ncbi:MAG TPA: SulP family inorganic anion transporter [Acidimicrobiales bacterium]|nr:SulP family inorganic anion transporter [Acidimicrobiales bacterium]